VENQNTAGKESKRQTSVDLTDKKVCMLETPGRRKQQKREIFAKGT